MGSCRGTSHQLFNAVARITQPGDEGKRRPAWSQQRLKPHFNIEIGDAASEYEKYLSIFPNIDLENLEKSMGQMSRNRIGSLSHSVQFESLKL